MRKLNYNELSLIEGGELTKEEIEAFLGAAACVTAFTSPFSALSCAYWVSTW